MKNKKNKGLTLVEVVIAMTLLVMIILMSIPMFTATVKIITRSRVKTTSTYESMSEIEKIKQWCLRETILNPEDLIEQLKKDGYVEKDTEHFKKIEGTIIYTLELVRIDGKNAIHLTAEKDGTQINEFYYILFFNHP